jgi:hypothetical protein
MRYRSPQLIVLALSLAALLAAAAARGAGAQADQRCFRETGFCIAGRLRTFWEQNGGLPVFGFPIAAQRAELIEERMIESQWFERSRLELHPENSAPYDVLLGRLGADRLRQQDRDWRAFPTSTPQAGCRFFAETSHNICGDMLAVWRAHGLEFDGRAGTSEAESLALFGQPLSDAQPETIGDGRRAIVQWFERACFELHPENPPPYDVLLGLLGAEVRSVAQPPTPTPMPTATPTPTATPRPRSRPRPRPTTTPPPRPTAKPTSTPRPTLPPYP